MLEKTNAITMPRMLSFNLLRVKLVAEFRVCFVYSFNSLLSTRSLVYNAPGPYGHPIWRGEEETSKVNQRVES